MNSTIVLHCKAGPCSSWPSTLRSVLIPAPRPITHEQTYNNFNPRRKRHPPGLIWKQTLGHCVYHDLSNEEKLGCLARQRRRFARLESLGLSGVILYEIPAGRDSKPLTQGEAPMQMTLKTIFGDPADPNEAGMDVNELLDAISAQIIYFPSYACTSFVTGQVMSAFFQQQPMIRPLPAREGFSVDAKAFVDSSFTVGANFALASCESFSSSVSLSSSIPLIKVHPAEDEAFFYNRFKDDLQHQLVSGLPDPFLAIANDHDGCGRDPGYVEDGYQNGLGQDLATKLSELNMTRRSCYEVETLDDIKGLVISHPSILSLVIDDYSPMISDEGAVAEKDDCNTSVSTLDSGGPQTPPRTPSRSCSPALSDTGDEYSSDSSLNEYASLAKRRRRKRLSLSLCCSAYDTSNDAKMDPNSDDHSSLNTDFFAESEPGHTQEPLTPIMTNFPGRLESQDRTPTHARTPIAKLSRPRSQAKATPRSRSSVGKENIAPLSIRPRRG